MDRFLKGFIGVLFAAILSIFIYLAFRFRGSEGNWFVWTFVLAIAGGIAISALHSFFSSK